MILIIVYNIIEDIQAIGDLQAESKMGKKRIEKITRIANENQRKVSLCKRKKGLIKKAMELSMLCS